VIALVIRQVDLEHLHMLVDGLRQSGLPGHEVGDADAAQPSPRVRSATS